MPNSVLTESTANLLIDFYDRMPRSIAACVDDPSPVKSDSAFSPGFLLPELDARMLDFLSVATASWQPLGSYGEHRLTLLDLTRNPGTGTTKTFPSLLIVARAVEYIRRYGEPITIFTPTSANKGTALRDAVLRAIEAGLVEPEQLRVVVLAPESCLAKLRSSRLSSDPALRALNPLLLYRGAEPEDVKAIGRLFADKYTGDVSARGGNLWYSLDLANYLVADTARAYFEHQVAPPDGTPRLHAHAVSSAFGLLGYHRGRAVLEEDGLADSSTRPASLLVQHLGTPDMVLNLRNGDFDRAGLPAFAAGADGLFTQSADPRFPQVTYDPAEVLDPTFYTHRPATSPAMNDLIARFGGDGIVVSLAECVARYPRLRELLAGTGCALPADLRTLREWSLVMAMTGVLNAVDRGLVESGRDIVVHGSGSYGAADYRLLEQDAIIPVDTVEDVAGAVLG